MKTFLAVLAVLILPASAFAPLSSVKAAICTAKPSAIATEGAAGATGSVTSDEGAAAAITGRRKP